MLIARFTDSRLLSAFWLVLFLIATSLAPAQVIAGDEEVEDDSPAEAIAVEDIQVLDTAPQSPSLLFDDPTLSVTRIEVAPLRERYRHLAALLDDVAGVRVTSFGGVGRSATVSIRGAGGRQVLVLLDGVPLSAGGEAADLSTLPLDQIAFIEVIRGSAGAVFGAGAVGGVINLVTHAATGQPQGSLRLEAGSQRTTGATLTQSHRGLLAQVQTLHSKGDFGFLNDNATEFNPADDFADRRRNNESHSTALLLRSAPRSQRRWSPVVTATGFWRTRGEPGIITFPSLESAEREASLRLVAAFTAHDVWQRESLSEVRLFGRWASRSFRDPLGEQTGVPLQTRQRDWLLGVRLGHSWSSGSDWLLSALSEITHEAQQDRSPNALEGGDHVRTSLALGLRAEWTPHDDWTIAGALRGDVLSDQPDRFSPRLGLAWRPAAGWEIKGSAGNGYRPPGFQELSENRGFVIGNPELRPEVSRSFDLGLTRTWDQHELTASWFRLETRDLIEYVQIGGFRFKPLNFGQTLAEGFELSGHGALDDRWSWCGAFTWQQVTDQTGGANRQGNRIPGRPDRFGSLGLTYREGDLALSADWQQVGPNAVTFANTRQLAGRDTLDLTLTLHCGAAVWTLQCANALDAGIADLRGFPLPGRTWSLAYTHVW